METPIAPRTLTGLCLGFGDGALGKVLKAPRRVKRLLVPASSRRLRALAKRSRAFFLSIGSLSFFYMLILDAFK